MGISFILGGTIDKLESIPGYQVYRSEQEMMDQVSKIGVVVCSTTEDITPLDQKTYALRDVTGTVSSIPLIAISIMSKKIAGGAKNFVFDMKYGEGALLKTKEESEKLGDIMKEIANFYHCKTDFLYSDMSHPLGYAIGNRLEVLEAMAVLQGKMKGELLETSISLASKMFMLVKNVTEEEAIQKVKEVIENKTAWNKFQEWISYQGGDIEKIKIEAKRIPYYAKQSGVITNIHAKEIALAAKALGTGREKMDDSIDPSSGIYLLKKEGESIKEGEILAYLYTNKETIPSLDSCFEIKNM